MKKILSILCLAAVLFTSCEPTSTSPVVKYNFGEIEVETKAKSATITADIPYVTVDGERSTNASFRLEYRIPQSGMSYSDVTTITEYRSEGNKVTFELEALEPETEYLAHIVLSHPEHGIKSSEGIPFTTKEYKPTYSITCDGEVEAKGLTATIKLTNVAYLFDNEPQDIKSLTVEYARLLSEGMEWVATEIDGIELQNGSVDVAIPANGADYLEENRDYLYRVTIAPKDETLAAITTDDVQFKTDYAVITADISTPELGISGDMLNVDVESVKVYYDGIYLPTYHYSEYYVYYRKVGSDDWSNKVEAEATERGMSLSIALTTLETGAEYEVAAIVVAGAMKKLRMSEVATITIPQNDTPTPPTPPEGGYADTTAIAGSWQLTQWRGAEPSFDVYLSISEDGVVTLWQKIDSRLWELYYSVVEYENDTIRGEYTDGTMWGTSYHVAVADDTMTWTDTTDATDISVYTRAELPEDIGVASQATTRTSSPRFL